MNDKDDLVFIEHILDSIHAIQNFSKGITKKELKSDRLRHSAIVREIEIIGEASKNISENLKNKHQEIQWREIIGTRDKLIHHYFGVDLDIIWNIVKIELPKLKEQMELIKQN